jgi:hypothetical protein
MDEEAYLQYKQESKDAGGCSISTEIDKTPCVYSILPCQLFSRGEKLTGIDVTTTSPLAEQPAAMTIS